MQEFDIKGKFYRAIQDNFMWRKGAILVFDEEQGSEGGYYPLNRMDIWDTTGANGEEYISARVIEGNPQWFERVYPVKKPDGSSEFVDPQTAEERYKTNFKPITIL